MFYDPQTLTRYPDGTLRVVYCDELKAGDIVFYGTDEKGERIRRTVIEIIEKRKSKGDFADKKNIPFSYRVKVA